MATRNHKDAALSAQLEHIYQTVMSSGISAVGAHEFREVIKDAVALEQQVETHDPSWLENRRTELLELYSDFRDRFDDTEYQQGKKDGLRIALVLLGLNVPPKVEALVAEKEG